MLHFLHNWFEKDDRRMRAIDLGGHSGCKILLYKGKNDKKFVRKISASISYNTRLEKQCKKQETYWDCGMYTPKVYQKGYDDQQKFFFDMEYIQGITLSQYIKTISVSNIQGLIDHITKPILLEQQTFIPETQSVFLSKIEQVKGSTKCRYWSSAVESMFETLEKHDWGRIPASGCHGDLTFENIIISGEKAYYIDFLDSFFDSWVLDFGKLLQDAQAMWSYRNEAEINTNTLIRLHIFRDLLREKTQSVIPGVEKELSFSLLLHLARVYPYVTDQKIFRFLDKKVSLTLDSLREDKI